MIKDLQVTLYDLFGYLLPGLVALLALAVLFWAAFFPEAAFPLSAPTEGGVHWTVLLVAGYLLGHLVQAVANLLKRWMPAADEELLAPGGDRALPAGLLAAARARAMAVSGLAAHELTPKLVYQVCDELVSQSGKLHDRDMYIYREGFYRGMAAASGLLSAALVVRAAVPGAQVGLAGGAKPLPWALLAVLALLALAAAWLFAARTLRFGSYKVTQAVLGALVVRAVAQEAAGKGEEAKPKRWTWPWAA